MKHLIYLNLIIFLVISSTLCAQKKQPQLSPNNIDEVIAAMTLEEKVYMVLGARGVLWDKPESHKTLIEWASGQTYDIKRLGIPATALPDGPAGVRIRVEQPRAKHSIHGTAFPVGTAMATTWNLPLEKEVGKAMGIETREYGCDVLLAPGLNQQRNPLTGRNFEYFSEDPLISGKMSAALVNGLQSEGVGGCIKHFAGNNAETNRKNINAIISQRALREMYLRGFEIAVKESKPWMVMSSYNRLNGFHTAESPELLKTVLRDEWKYDGVVVTDWHSGTDWVAQMRAGNELLMPGTYQKDYLMRACKTGLLDEATLDRNIKYILQYVVKTPNFKKHTPTFSPNLEAHQELARRAADEAMVLLKNDGNTLPMNKLRKVALFGKTSYHIIAVGVGSGGVNYKYAPSLHEAMEENDILVNNSLKAHYTSFVEKTINAVSKDKKTVVSMTPEPAMSRDMIQKQVKETEVAIITIGRNAGEGKDTTVGGYFELTKEERALIKDVCEIYHAAKKRVIVLLNIGSPIEIESWGNYPDAILLTWQSGQEAGRSIVDILTGEVNPSGKLAVTFPKKYSDVPSATSFPGEPMNNPVNAYHNEGIYVGYRYYDSFNIDPAYEFGFGKSYTTFEYSNLKLSSNTFGEKLNVSVTIKNTGKYAGKEVVQLYLSAPSTILEKPIQELKGFNKTKKLAPGESETLSFVLEPKDLASFWSGKSQWIADKGEYEVRIGASSRDIRTKSNFEVDKEMMVEQVNDVLFPNTILIELSTKDPIYFYPTTSRY